MQTLKKIECTSVTDVHASFCLFFKVKNIFKLNSLMFLLIDLLPDIARESTAECIMGNSGGKQTLFVV